MSDPDFDFSFNKIDYIAHREAHDASAILLAFVPVLWFMIGMAIPSPYGDWILMAGMFFLSLIIFPVWIIPVLLAIIIIGPIITKIEEIRGKTFEWNK